MRGRVGATRSRYKTLARRLIDRITCAPGAARRWHKLRARCPVKSVAGSVPLTESEEEWKSKWYGSGENPRRRRRRNGRRARYHYRRRNTMWTPSYAMNGIGKSLTTGFQPELLAKGAVTLVGLIGNAIVNDQLDKLSFTPAFLKSGVGSYVKGLGTAGVTGALVGLAAPKYAFSVAFGGILQQIIRGYNEYIAPRASFLPKLGHFDDYATVEDVRNARPLGCLFGGCGGGLGQYNSPGYNPVTQLFNPAIVTDDGNNSSGLLGMGCMNGNCMGCMNGNCMGDYLTRENAANARPLGRLGYTLNDAAIDGTATTELGSVS
jgi:hypothetical protein